VIGALIATKLWLASGLTVTAYGTASHDDQLYLLMTNRILSGAWLGRPYGSMSLAKGPFYPVFVLISWALGLPLLFAEQVLYVAAAAFFVWAIRPWFPSRFARAAVFAVLLFNPLTWHGQIATRVVREGIYPALALLVLACAAGLLGRLDRSRGEVSAWAGGLGLALGAFWLTREEGIWLVPSLLVLAFAAIIRLRTAWKPLAWALPPFVIALAFLPVLFGSISDYRYGVFATNEFREHPFQAAMGALQRVYHSSWHLDVPVPTETRERIYAVSPRFAELRPFLEGNVGYTWTLNTCAGTGGRLCNEIGSGWFVWAFRDAVEQAGYYRRGGKAVAAYYEAVAAEINQACEARRLACGPKRDSLMPPLHREQWPVFVAAVRRSMELLIRPEEASPGPSTGTWEQLALFRDLTRDRLAPTIGNPPNEPSTWQGHHQARLDGFKLRMLFAIGRVYRALILPALILAMLGFAFLVVRDIRSRTLTGPTVIALSFLVGILARIGLLSTVSATSFWAIETLYLSSAYPFLFGFLGVVMAEVAMPLARAATRLRARASREVPAS
jgi:4-amino-4-deoxy-L-arabinose transferase-like glycosyltransferase